MFDQPGGSAGIGDGGHDLPSFAACDRKKAVYLRSVAKAVQQLLAPVDGETVYPGALLDEAVGFVHQSGKEYFRHD